MTKPSDHVLRYSVHSRLREYHLRRLLPKPARGRMLDAGCGLGYLSQALGQGYERVGLDSDHATLAALADPCGCGLDLAARGSLSRLPFADESFDLVLCSEVLEHLPEGLDQEAVSELARVLRPGGRLLVTVPALEGMRATSRLRNLGHDDPAGGEYHHRMGYRWPQLEKMFARAGGLSLASRRYSMVLVSELFMDLTKLVFLGKKALAGQHQVESAKSSPLFRLYRLVFPLLHACFVAEDLLLAWALKGHIHVVALDKTAAPAGRRGET